MNRPASLAAVGYSLTAVGFIQVAVTIAPHIADSVPAAGAAAPAVGAAVALAIDVCWAALMHTTIQTYRNGQTRAALGFGAATAAAVATSTILLAAVGHMGPWSVVPILAALLLVADGIREHVSVSPETSTVIRQRAAEIRDARALAAIEAKHDAHTETIKGYRESTRLSARTAALAEIRTTVQQANYRAAKRIESSQKRFSLPATDSTDSPESNHTNQAIQPWFDLDITDSANESPDSTPSPDQVNHSTRTNLSVVPASNDDDLVSQILDLADKGLSQRKIAELLNTNQSRVSRAIRSRTA